VCDFSAYVNPGGYLSHLRRFGRVTNTAPCGFTHAAVISALEFQVSAYWASPSINIEPKYPGIRPIYSDFIRDIASVVRNHGLRNGHSWISQNHEFSTNIRINYARRSANINNYICRTNWTCSRKQSRNIEFSRFFSAFSFNRRRFWDEIFLFDCLLSKKDDHVSP